MSKSNPAAALAAGAAIHDQPPRRHDALDEGIHSVFSGHQAQPSPEDERFLRRTVDQ